MAVYPLSFVTISPSSERFQLQRRQAIGSSPFTYAQQGVNTAAQWRLEWTWPQMRLADAEFASAWLNTLRGQLGTFRYAPRLSRSRTALTGRSLNVAGYAYNTSVQIKGWAAGAASTLYVGQFFQLGEQLLQVASAPLNADGNGCCIVDFEPSLRITLAANTAVNFATPAGKFRLASSDGYGFTLTPGNLCEFGTIQAVEAVE